MKEKKIEDKYKVLDQISHILLRPNTYVGSNKPNTSFRWILNDDKMVKKEITIVPSFLKIVDEVITNSVDESKREGSKLKTIKVTINDNIISIWDDGGIPVVVHKEHNLYLPEVIFGNLLSGSNYDDSEDRIVAGTNGLGAKLTNVFSKSFIVSTCDGKNSFLQTFQNNMRERNKVIIKKSKNSHTEIKFSPDYEKFGMNGIDDDHFKMIEKRVYDLASCNSSLKIYFNNELININSFDEYVKLYVNDFFSECNKDKSWSVAVSLSENGFQHISFANSTETYDGGTHIDYIMNQIILELREFFSKKYKVDVKPSELKNHIFLFLNSTVVNPSFSSQTKEKLITEIKDFGYIFEISKKLVQNILKSDIVNSILDWIDQKKNADDSKLQRELNKKLSKIKVEKLIDAREKDRWKCTLGLFEGDSASGAFRKYREKHMGAFSLKGKFINVSEIGNKKLVENAEAVNLMAAIGLKLGQPIDIKHLRYGKILLYTDADYDGNAISALLINFFYKYWPDIFERGMVYKVETPILVATIKGKKEKILFYTQSEYNTWAVKVDIKKYDIKYKKGLAALVDDEYQNIITNPRMTKITKDEASTEFLDVWFGKNSDLRKNELLK